MRMRVSSNQILPADVIRQLRELNAAIDTTELDRLLLTLHLNGWTQQACADALGVTRQRIQQRIKAADRPSATDMPMAPRKPTPMPQPPRQRLLVPPDVAEQLRAQYAIAQTINGGTPADDPRRQISVEFSAALASLNAQGVSVYQLAQVLGVDPSAVFQRLARFGYRDPAPSAASKAYQGRAWYEKAGIDVDGR